MTTQLAYTRSPGKARKVTKARPISQKKAKQKLSKEKFNPKHILRKGLEGRELNNNAHNILTIKGRKINRRIEIDATHDTVKIKLDRYNSAGRIVGNVFYRLARQTYGKFLRTPITTLTDLNEFLEKNTTTLYITFEERVKGQPKVKQPDSADKNRESKDAMSDKDFENKAELPAVQPDFRVVTTTQDLGEVLYEARNRADNGQEEIAEIMGTGQSTIYKIEKGKTNPTWNTIAKFANANSMKIELRLIPK